MNTNEWGQTSKPETFAKPLINPKFFDIYESDMTKYGYFIDKHYEKFSPLELLKEGMNIYKGLTAELVRLRDIHFRKVKRRDPDTAYTRYTKRLHQFCQGRRYEEIGFLSQSIRFLYQDNPQNICTDFPDNTDQERILAILKVMTTSELRNLPYESYEHYAEDATQSIEIPEGIANLKQRAARRLAITRLMRTWFPDIPEMTIGLSVMDNANGWSIIDMAKDERFQGYHPYHPAQGIDFHKIPGGEDEEAGIESGLSRAYVLNYER